LCGIGKACNTQGRERTKLGVLVGWPKEIELLDELGEDGKMLKCILNNMFVVDICCLVRASKMVTSKIPLKYI
jgi:hypothetical protein